MFNIPQDVPFPSYSLILYLWFKKKKSFYFRKEKKGTLTNIGYSWCPII